MGARQTLDIKPRFLLAEPVVDRHVHPLKPRLFSTKLVVSRPLSDVDGLHPTELVTKVLSVQLTGVVDRLLSTKLVVDRPLALSDVDRLLSTELVVDKPPSAVTPTVDSRVVDRPPSAVTPTVDTGVVDRPLSAVTPTIDSRVVFIYGRLSSAKSRGVRVRVRTRVLGFP